MSAHTKGPWDWRSQGVFGLQREERFSVYPNHGDLARSVAVVDGPNSDDNARLIAAAPDLLAACEAAKAFVFDDTCRHDSEKAPLLALLRAAIARARGGK